MNDCEGGERPYLCGPASLLPPRAGRSAASSRAAFPHSERVKPAMSPIISVANLSKTYGSGFKALNNINLEINRGEIFALLGPNGAGKTTLISIICGIANPSEGTVIVGGHDIIKRLSRRALADRPGAAGTAHRRLRNGVGDRQLQPRPVRQAEEPRAYREGAEGPVAVGQEGRQDRHAVRRHEAPGDDRESAVARAADPVSRRADRGRRRRIAQGHVGGGADAAGLRRHHHPHHALHRRGRGDGRPHRRHQQGRDHPGRGQGRR